MNTGPTRAEVCVVACAEAWRGDGAILASPMGLIPTLGARPAQLTFAPDLLLTDGEAHLLAPGGGARPAGGPVPRGARGGHEPGRAGLRHRPPRDAAAVRAPGSVRGRGYRGHRLPAGHPAQRGADPAAGPGRAGPDPRHPGPG